jgi:hypothetical protein
MTETLRTLIEKHPEWANLPIVVYRTDGSYDFIGCSGSIYTGECTEEDKIANPEIKTESVLVFSGN